MNTEIATAREHTAGEHNKANTLEAPAGHRPRRQFNGGEARKITNRNARRRVDLVGGVCWGPTALASAFRNHRPDRPADEEQATKGDTLMSNETLTPEEVREILMGEGREPFGGEPKSIADMPSSKDGKFRNLGNRTPHEAVGMMVRHFEATWEEVDGVRFIDMMHTNMVYAGYPRCPTCGRTNDCCCPGCEYCVNGIPRTSTKEKEEVT